MSSGSNAREPMFQRSAVRMVAVGKDVTVALLPGAARPVPLLRRTADMLSTCTAFAPLAEHARRIGHTLGLAAGEQPALLAALEEAAGRGLLVSAAEVIAAAAAGPPAPRPPRIGALGVLTRGRREAVRRCLASYAEHLGRFGRRLRVTVVDSAPSPDGALEEAAGDPRVRWMTRRSKDAFVEALATASGADRALVAFALEGCDGVDHDIGANRNTLLLAHAGEAFLSTDDDMVCEPRRRRASADGVVIDDDAPAMPVTLHRDFASARDSLVSTSSCLLDEHEALLGWRLGARLAHGGGRAELRALSPAMVASLLGGETTVAATFAGHYGDAGARYPGFYLWSSLDVRDQVLEGPAAYRGLATSRQVVRLPPVTIVNAGRFCMCGTVALDCRQLLPPFFPSMRGEDLVFGMVLRAAAPDSVFGYVAEAVAHRPWQEREPAIHLWDPAGHVPLSAILGQIIEVAEVGARVAPTGERRLCFLGRGLQEVARLQRRAFQDLLRERMVLFVARAIGSAQRLLEQAGGQPDYWAADLRRFVEHQGRMLDDPAVVVPGELAARGGADDVTETLQSWIGTYGRLLEAWPALWAAAARLRAPS